MPTELAGVWPALRDHFVLSTDAVIFSVIALFMGAILIILIWASSPD